jgi:hypothetical protein
LLPTGAGESKDVTVTGLNTLQLVDFQPDGKLLLLGSEAAGHGVRCYGRSMDGGPIKALTPEGVSNCIAAPDSRRVVASDRVHGISVYPLDGQVAHVIPDTNSLVPIRWADNQSVLAYRTDELPARVFQIDVTSGKQRLVRELAPGDRAGVSQLQTVAATADGRTFAYSYQQVLYDLYVVEGLR